MFRRSIMQFKQSLHIIFDFTLHNLCDASHKLCYVERPLMLSNRSESLLDRRNIERSVDGRDVLAAHKQVCSVA